MSTIFSKIIAGEIPSYKIAEDDKFYAFLDINPMAKGHTLVVPKIEVDVFFDLEDSSISEIMLFAKKVAKGIKDVIPCNRVGVMVVGLDVPHAHVHLIPLNKSSDMSLSEPKLNLSKEEFEIVANKISSTIDL